MELGSVTLKRIGFFCFPIKHSTHTKTLFFSIISTEVDPQGRDGGTPGAPAAQRHDSGGGAGESAVKVLW